MGFWDKRGYLGQKYGGLAWNPHLLSTDNDVHKYVHNDASSYLHNIQNDVHKDLENDK